MENKLLIKSVDEILVVDHYRDTRTSSKDDITRDYYYFCYNGDKYLQELIEDGLSNSQGRIEKNVLFIQYIYMTMTQMRYVQEVQEKLVI